MLVFKLQNLTEILKLSPNTRDTRG